MIGTGFHSERILSQLVISKCTHIIEKFCYTSFSIRTFTFFFFLLFFFYFGKVNGLASDLTYILTHAICLLSELSMHHRLCYISLFRHFHLLFFIWWFSLHCTAHLWLPAFDCLFVHSPHATINKHCYFNFYCPYYLFIITVFLQ